MPNLASLPDELIDMVSEFLNDDDIPNLRSQCRTLRKGTHFAFCNRFLRKPREVTGSRASIGGLTEILCNPIYSPAEAFTQELTVYKPTTRDMPSGSKSILPTGKDINSLLAALPELKSLTITTEETDVDIEDDYNVMTKALLKMRENLAPALLKALGRKGCPISRLTTLNFHDCFLDGAIIVELLLAHKHSLKDVQLKLIRLKDGEDPLELRPIFRTMLQLDLDKLTVEHVFNPGERKYFMMHNHSRVCDDEDESSYESWEETRHHTTGEVLTGYAHFYRSKFLFVESYVKLGLSELLGNNQNMYR
jgi:hypothetical protein